MYKLILLFSFLVNAHAQVHHPELPPELIHAPYPVSRYFRTIPLNKAYAQRGTARFEYLNKDKVSLLIWNIQKLKQKQWEDEFNKLAEGKDLILFQEAYENKIFIEKTSALQDFTWDFAQSFEYLLYGVTTGNMIGSNTRNTNAKVLHSPDLEPVLDTPKATMATTYPIIDSDKELLVISIHGINFTTNNKFYRQLNQIFALIDQHDGPVIFGGDFNTHNNKRFDFMMREAKKRNLINLDFRDSYLRKKFSGNILDHTLARGVEVIDSYIPTDIQGSDHSPMVLEVKIIN